MLQGRVQDRMAGRYSVTPQAQHHRAGIAAEYMGAVNKGLMMSLGILALGGVGAHVSQSGH